MVAVSALDIVTDKVPASNDLAEQEEGVGLSGNKTGLQVLVLGNVLPHVGRAGSLGELGNGLLGSLKLSTSRRGHTLADVNLLCDLTSNLGVVQHRAYSAEKIEKQEIMLISIKSTSVTIFLSRIRSRIEDVVLNSASESRVLCEFSTVLLVRVSRYAPLDRSCWGWRSDCSGDPVQLIELKSQDFFVPTVIGTYRTAWWQSTRQWRGSW